MEPASKGVASWSENGINLTSRCENRNKVFWNEPDLNLFGKGFWGKDFVYLSPNIVVISHIMHSVMTTDI